VEVSGERKLYLRWLVLVIATGLALYVCWQMLQPFIEVLVWAAVLVIVFFPIHREIAARTQHPGWSAMLSTLLVLVTILAPVSLITVAVMREMWDVASQAQTWLAAHVESPAPLLARLTRWLNRYVNLGEWRPQQYLAEQLNNLSNQMATRTLGLVSGVVGGVVKAFFTVFTMYYLFRDGDGIRRALRSVIPLERPQADQIFDRTREVIYASVYGVLMIAAIQGALGGLAFWALGLPSPLLWGVVMFLLSTIPLAGSFVVWVPGALYLLVNGHWGKALLLVAWGTLVVGTIDNVLRPKLVGQRTRLHELLIFFSVLGGLQLFGVVGLVLGPVIVAVTLALFDIFQQLERPFGLAPPEPKLLPRPAERRAS
jgi:predicted PurR-regulated permease PerM